MPFFDTVQPAAFEGQSFPVDRVEVNGGMRDHVHEYSHQDGGSPELLGRRLYVIRMHCNFDEEIGKRFKHYAGNYPEGLAFLRELFEKGTKGELTIPTLGTIRAYCRDWPQTWTAQVRSGESAEFTFVEVPSELAFTGTIDLDSMGGLKVAFFDAFAKLNIPKPSLLDELEDAINNLLVLRDQAGLALMQLEVAVLKVEAIIREVDRTLAFVQNAAHWPVIEAMKDLWASTQKLALDIAQQQSPIQTFKVPRLMSASQISMALYGTPTRAIELLQMNDLEDAFAVPAGTSVRYYAA